MSRTAYRKGQVIGLTLLVVWVAAGGAAILYWKVLSGGWKVALALLSVLIAPGLRDVKGVFRSYERYLTDWDARRSSPTGETNHLA